MDEIKESTSSTQPYAGSKIFSSNTFIVILICSLIILGVTGVVLMVNGFETGLGSTIKEPSTQTITDVWNISQGILKYRSKNNGTWPRELADLNNTNKDSNGFDKITLLPDCTYIKVTDATPGGCEWADDTHLRTLLVPRFIQSIPHDTGKYSHYFVALTPDESQLIVMSASSNYIKAFKVTP